MLNSSSKEFVEFNHARIQYTDYPHIDYFDDSVQSFDGEYYFDGVGFYYRDGKREHGNVQIDNIDYNLIETGQLIRIEDERYMSLYGAMEDSISEW